MFTTIVMFFWDGIGTADTTPNPPYIDITFEINRTSDIRFGVR